jgi:hypothetical protein
MDSIEFLSEDMGAKKGRMHAIAGTGSEWPISVGGRLMQDK